jgi:hypothetical protein
MMNLSSTAYRVQKFRPRLGVLPETPQHATCAHRDVCLFDPTGCHALVFCLDYDPNSLWIQDLIDRFGYLLRQSFLDLQPFSESFDDTG